MTVGSYKDVVHPAGTTEISTHTVVHWPGMRFAYLCGKRMPRQRRLGLFLDFAGLVATRLRKSVKYIVTCIILLAIFSQAGAQLLAAEDHVVAMGHHHLNAENIEDDKAFWVSLGGESVEFADYQVVRFPNVLVFLREQSPGGGTDGSVVNHIGLQFPELRSVVVRLRANGTPIITKDVVGDRYAIDADGLAFNTTANTFLAFALAPNGTQVELYETKGLEHSVANHHIHFYGPDVDEMKSWYVDILGARPGQRSGMEAADLGGVNLTFSPTEQRLAGTQGRSLDHIGFEVEGLEAFCQYLELLGVEFDLPYQQMEDLGLAMAFFTDPWGNYIELTEGLDRL